MASNLTSSISEEMLCSICLDFFTRAISIECGHNFCEQCILQYIYLTDGNSFRCPECRKDCVSENLWPNQQLSIVAQSFKLLQSHLERSLNLRKVIKIKFHEEISLDPETAHPGIIISTDMKTMRERDSWKKLHHTVERSDLCGPVLATQSFVSGRHYWEVTVGNSSAWDVGLCKNSVKRIAEVSPSSSNGCWLLSLRQNNYIVCTTPRTRIPLRGKLCKVGIFLDYEAGDIVFYDVDSRCHIYTFTSSFLEPLWPVFAIGLHSKSENILSIDPIVDEAEETTERDDDHDDDTSFVTLPVTSSKKKPHI
ncbi:E3 ubiquitin-protein ligase TRIM39-like [Trichosurus vulpecula]|uniref:E3 ubiquitin-protein ligase TRIM39-like n=1 Tax=Trichosurus vulpecula TaxID=9337 RepID=UPI00186AD015|nr:E3 ubiquitin-protein ligase TRIM39-like [Trichosurus vulpecula]